MNKQVLKVSREMAIWHKENIRKTLSAILENKYEKVVPKDTSLVAPDASLYSLAKTTKLWVGVDTPCFAKCNLNDKCC